MVGLYDILRANAAGIVRHLDIAGVQNLLATSKDVQRLVAPVLAQTAQDFCGVEHGHALEKHCLARLPAAVPNWLSLVAAFQENRGKGKANQQAKILLVNQIKPRTLAALAPPTVATLRRRVIGIDPASGRLLDDPTKSDSSAFVTEFDFNSTLLWMAKAFDALAKGPLAKRTGRFRYKGHTLEVTYMPKLGGYKIIVPIAAVLPRPADQAISFGTTLKFPEIAATIADLFQDVADKKNPDQAVARMVIDGVTGQVTKPQSVTSVVAIFKAERDGSPFLYSMYPE